MKAGDVTDSEWTACARLRPMPRSNEGETIMYSQSDIEDAVEAGALDAGQAARFRSHVAERRGQSTVDEEYFRFIVGFNDIFIAITCLLVIVAAGWLGSLLPPHIGGYGPSPFIAIFPAAAAWGLSELFAVRRRTALASIILVIGFAYSLFFGLMLISAAVIGDGAFGGFSGIESLGWLAVLAALVTSAGLWKHWQRFRVPFAHAAMVGFGVLALVALVAALFMPVPDAMFGTDSGSFADFEDGMERFQTVLAIALLIAGIGTFLYAMQWDSSDRLRQTDRSEVGFWLHWLAAALLVHSLVSLLGIRAEFSGAGSAIAIVILYVLFAVIALLTSRRAILLLALSYLIYAVNALLGGAEGGGRSISSAMMAIFVVSLILLLLAFTWSQLRAALVGAMPEWLQAKLPAIDPVDPPEDRNQPPLPG